MKGKRVRDQCGGKSSDGNQRNGDITGAVLRPLTK